MGFAGFNPCPQTHGEKKFYEAHQSPLKLLKEGNYNKVPLMAGGCANDGTLVMSSKAFKHSKLRSFFMLRSNLYSVLTMRNLTLASSHFCVFFWCNFSALHFTFMFL